jgi:hypothetical protein
MKTKNNANQRYSRLVDVVSDLTEDIADTEKELMRLSQSGRYYSIRDDLSAFIKQTASNDEKLKDLLKNVVKAYDAERTRLCECMTSLMLDTAEAKEYNRTRSKVAEAVFKASISNMYDVVEKKELFPLFN